MSEKNNEVHNEVPDIQVTVKYCDRSCLGLMIRHCHFVITRDGEEGPESPPFPSKRVGKHIANSEPVKAVPLEGFQAKFFDALKSVNLPEAMVGDEALMDRIDADGESTSPTTVIIRHQNYDDPHSKHFGFEYEIEHGNCVVLRKGCLICGSSSVGVYIDNRLFAGKDGILLIEQAAAFVDEVAAKLTELLEIASSNNVAALRAKLPELFPENKTSESR